MKTTFQEFKIELLKRAKEAQACKSEYKKAAESETIEELVEILIANIGFVTDKKLITKEMIENYERPEVFNSGKDNIGLFNSGNLNSGCLNSGDRNSGDLNSGDLNSGNRNSGDRNSGNRNSGHLNSGDRNSGYLNSGDQNSGDQNSGDRNSGDQNSGYLNSGYLNSGVFCTRKREDTILIFNKESGMTWDQWYNHPAYNASLKLNIIEWVSWNNMSDQEKKDHPKACVTEGYVKVYTYHEAWANLWINLSGEQKGSFKTLPNFDSEIFKEITGIELN
jgi:hypothetical protein